MSLHSTCRRCAIFALGWLIAGMLALLVQPTPVLAAPTLVLPTPPGEPWRIIQGYACGTHNGRDRYALDLAQVNGPTYNAPIRAAAAGTLWHWEPRSGTIILAHGNNFFTMYTHLSRPVTTEREYAFAVGDVVGYAGDRGSPGIPHLHFMAYTAGANGWSQRQSVPLKFAEGYDLPEIGGCNQHGGKILTAMALQDPLITFTGEALPFGWYNIDHQIDFSVTWGVVGLARPGMLNHLLMYQCFLARLMVMRDWPIWVRDGIHSTCGPGGQMVAKRLPVTVRLGTTFHRQCSKQCRPSYGWTLHSRPL